MDSLSGALSALQTSFATLSPAGKIATAVASVCVLYQLVSYATRRRWNAKGRVIVITGASSGIGAEVARQYAREGAKLVLFARREKELEIIAEECRKAGSPGVVTVKGDVSIRADCSRLMQAAAGAFGGIDCLVLNAGISMGEYFEDLPDTDIIRRLMDVNYHGCVDCAFYAVPYLKQSDASKITIISSLAGKTGCPTRTGYCGSKFALQGFFDALRMELGPKYGTTVTLICPGPVRTDINRTRLGGDNTKQLDLSHGMPVEQAGNIILNATAYGEREVRFGISGKVGKYMQCFFPELTDKFVIAKVTQMMSADKKSN